MLKMEIDEQQPSIDAVEWRSEGVRTAPDGTF